MPRNLGIHVGVPATTNAEDYGAGGYSLSRLMIGNDYETSQNVADMVTQSATSLFVGRERRPIQVPPMQDRNWNGRFLASRLNAVGDSVGLDDDIDRSQ